MSLSLVALVLPVLHRNDEADNLCLGVRSAFWPCRLPEFKTCAYYIKMTTAIDSYLGSGQTDPLFPEQCWRGLQIHHLFMILPVLRDLA